MTETVLPARDYDLAATLDSGQAFRFQRSGDSWTGVVGGNWVRLTQRPGASWPGPRNRSGTGFGFAIFCKVTLICKKFCGHFPMTNR